MFAANLKDKKNSLILEHNLNLGAKILISGGGRCNFTNRYIETSDYLADKDFILPILKEYSPKKILNWFKSRGLEYSLKNGREYFCKNSSKEILNILQKEIKGINIVLNSEVIDVEKDGNIFKVITNKEEFHSKKLIVASGGLSFSKLGASDIGYKIAKKFRHNIIAPKPALVGFTLQPSEFFWKSLSGVSVDVEVKVENKKFKAPLLFAHKGVSGPAILNASLFWENGYIEVDFLPDFDFNSIKYSSKALSNLLPLPKRVAKAFLEKLEIKDKVAKKLSKDEWEKLQILKAYKFAPSGTFGFSKAEVTKGGVDTDEIDINLMSKKEKNLYFLGEVLNVTGRLGGFNFHWAFASAMYLAKSIK